MEKARILGPELFEPTHHAFSVIGVFNPAAARVEDGVVLLVRVAESCPQEDPRYVVSPRCVGTEGDRPAYRLERVDVFPDGGWDDHRKPLVGDGRYRRLAFVSHVEMVWLENDGRTVREVVRHPQLLPRTPEEEFGVEDPRVTFVGGRFMVTYVSVSESTGVCTSLMETQDFRRFARRGIIFCRENKDVVLFPSTREGRYMALHRPVGAAMLGKLAIMYAESPDGVHWGMHRHVLSVQPGTWYADRIGAGAPPIRWGDDWMVIFHGVRKRGPDDTVGLYAGGAMVLDGGEPWRVKAVSREPFLVPEEPFEREGFVKDVVFPTAVLPDPDDEGMLHVYYGCADTCVAVASLRREEVEETLQWL